MAYVPTGTVFSPLSVSPLIANVPVEEPCSGEGSVTPLLFRIRVGPFASRNGSHELAIASGPSTRFGKRNTLSAVSRIRKDARS
jgi:hypothetical protein